MLEDGIRNNRNGEILKGANPLRLSSTLHKCKFQIKKQTFVTRSQMYLGESSGEIFSVLIGFMRSGLTSKSHAVFQIPELSLDPRHSTDRLT